MTTGQMTIDEARKEFVGKPYSREISRAINRTGFGFSASMATGNIDEIYETAKPKSKVKH